jgi:hypothetical protein
MKFIELVEELGGCNDMPMKPLNKIDFGPLNIDMLDSQSARLSGDEISIFLDGEVDEVAEITERLGIDELDSILNRVFDGDLHDVFYE